MRVEVINTLEVLSEISHLDMESRRAVWQGRVVDLFQPLMHVISMDFAGMGACDFSTAYEECRDAVEKLNQGRVVERILEALEKAFRSLQERGKFRFPEVLHVGVFVSNGKNAIHNDLNHGFSGFGGIPGFITLILSPTEYVLRSIEALAVHELHHNVRFLEVDPWPHDMQISTGKFILDEGLAEAFAAELYGEELIGPQTIGLSADALAEAEQIIWPHVREKGFQQASSFLYGDAMADTMGYPKRGLPHAAGYAVGYHWIRQYMAATGKDIFEISRQTSEEILVGLGPRPLELQTAKKPESGTVDYYAT